MVSSEDHNQSVWKKFLSLRQTLRTEQREYDEWHKGRKEYAVWTICIQNRSVQSRFDAARAHLVEFLLEPYQRQPHVTLFVCGFLAEVERFNDDYTIQELEHCIRELKEAKLAPFEIKIGGVNSFAAVPFLEVFDVSGGIEKIRNVLSGNRSEGREEEYVPHMTLGLYSSHFETKIVAAKLASFYLDTPIDHVVDEINLTTYLARNIGGPLSVKYVVNLEAK